MICRVFGRKDCKLALAVAKAENSRHICNLEVNEPNSTISYGVFQINSIHILNKASVAELKTCLGNIRVAKMIYDRQGHFESWSAYTNKRYLKFYEN